MAIQLNPGSGGAVIAAEEDSSTEQHQKMLVEYGDLGEQNRVTNRLGLPVTTADGPASDAFGRFRVSAPTPIFDNKQLWDNSPGEWDDQETSGSGTTSTHIPAGASTVLGTSLNTAGTRIRQTFTRFNYQPGKSQLVVMTGVLGTPALEVTRRIGYFDDENGLFFNQDGINSLGVAVRSSITGSPVDNIIPQASWNLDKMDGTGPSGVTINPANSQIFHIDFQWLGSGRVRFGFGIAGRIIYVHEFLRANLAVNPYMSTPNLPVRFEISSTVNSPAANMVHTCVSVATEGGAERSGTIKYLSTGSTGITAASIGTIYALKGIRLKATNLDASTLVDHIEVLITAGGTDFGEWTIIINPVLSAPLIYSDAPGTPYQEAKGDGVITVVSGVPAAGGYALPGRQGATTARDIPSAPHLGSFIDGTPTDLVLCFTPLTAGVTVYGSVIMRENY